MATGSISRSLWVHIGGPSKRIDFQKSLRHSLGHISKWSVNTNRLSKVTQPTIWSHLGHFQMSTNNFQLSPLENATSHIATFHSGSDRACIGSYTDCMNARSSFVECLFRSSQHIISYSTFHCHLHWLTLSYNATLKLVWRVKSYRNVPILPSFCSAIAFSDIFNHYFPLPVGIEWNRNQLKT